jgi:hypothetical protein
VVVQVSGNECVLDDTQMTLTSLQTQCFYNLSAKPLYYFVFDDQHPRCNPLYKGQINIEKCKSKTFIIK